MLSLFLPVALAAEPTLVEVPYERAPTGHYLVPVSVEGAPAVPFVLDTGASVTVIAPEVWRAAGGDPDRGLKVGARGAGGKVAPMRIATDVDFVLGGAPVRVGAALLMDFPAPAEGDGDTPGGLIGRDLLRRYVVELDEAAGTLRLHPPGATPVPDLEVLPMHKVRAGLTSVTVTIGGVPIPAVLDLGAAVSILNGPARALAGVAPIADCVGVGMGLDQQELRLDCVQVGALGLGGVTLTEVPLHAGDLPIFGPLRLDDEPAMILGADVLGDRHLVLDDGRRQLGLSRQPVVDRPRVSLREPVDAAPAVPAPAAPAP